ncbi:hypothetical protein GCM10009562_41780 [Nocardioides aquaticus]
MKSVSSDDLVGALERIFHGERIFPDDERRMATDESRSGAALIAGRDGLAERPGTGCRTGTL